jgi:hypothetical protein
MNQMKKLLTLKHWHLFVLLMGVPIVMQIILLASLISDSNPLSIMIFFPFMMLFLVAVLFGWLYAVGTNLHKRLPASVYMNVGLFKAFMFIPAMYLLLISGLVFSVFLNIPKMPEINPAIFLVIVPLHIFSIVCIFYCLYFNAKALKTVELQKPATVSEYIGEFFLIWFFPIGIWFIQPRINKLFATNE